MSPPLEDRFAGSLIGQALGDALGFVVEGHPPARCRRYVDEVLKAGRAGEGGRAPYPFGQYTDDTQLARELLESYVACKGFDPADYARRIAAIFAEGRIVGRGRTTEAAALRLAQGVSWDQAGTPAPAAGNGSAMRAGPVGLMSFDDPDGLIRAARDQGRITHADPRCSAGAVAIAGAVALALGGGSVEPARFLGQLAGWTRAVEGSLASCLGRLVDWTRLAPEDAQPLISAAGIEPGYSDRWEGISPFVTASVLWSLYAFLKSPGDYWQTISTAIAVGGDVDTTAAMAGAVSGAYNGLAAVPGDLAGRLNDQGTWDYDALVALAREAYRVKTGER